MMNSASIPAIDESLQRVFDGLARAGVPYVILRGFDPITELAGSVDIDLFIPARHFATASAVIHQAGWSRRAVQTGRYPHCFFDAWDHADGVVRSIDVVTDLCYGQQLLTLRGASLVAEAGVMVNGVRVPSPWHALFTLALHVALDKRGLSPNNARRVQAALVRAKGDAAGAQRIVAEFGEDAREFVEAFIETATAAGCDLAPLNARARRLRCLKAHPWRARLTQSRARLRQFRRPVVRVAILGIDGSGKSTLIDALANAPSTVRLWHGYLGSNHYRTYPARFLERQLARYHGANAAPPDVMQRVWANLRTLWLPVELAARMVIAEHRSEVVLYDRFPIGQDDGAPTTLWGRCMFAYTRFARALLPRPDLVVLLDGDDRTIWARKKESPFEVHQRTQARYRAAVAAFHGDHAFVRTDRSLSDSMRELRAAIADAPAVRRKLYDKRP